MTDFGVNLIQTRVPPLEKRRKIFRNVVLYLAMCGVALVVLLHACMRDLIFTIWHRSDLHAMEQEFRADHPGHRDILWHAADVEGRGETLAGVLDAVQQNVAARSDVALMLAGIATALSHKIRLIEFTLDSHQGIATFDLAVPIGTETGEMTDPGQLAGLWNRDAALASSLRQIQSVASHRRMVNGKPAFVLRFSGKLPDLEE